MTPIRVLFHVTHLRRGGGIEASLLSWLHVLDRTRFTPALSIAFPTDELELLFLPRLPSDVTVYVLGTPWLSYTRRLKMAGALRWPGRIYEELLLPQIRKHVFRNRMARIACNCDLIIDYDMSLVRFAGGFGKPLIGISHFRFPRRADCKPSKYRALLHYYHRYDAIVAICDAMRDGGIRLFPTLAARFVTMYPGFDSAEILRRAAEIDESVPQRPYLIAVTRLEETQKDVTTLLHAYAQVVRTQRIDEQLLIVGHGRHQVQLEALAASLGIANRTQFRGFTPNPLPLIRQARLLVLSSRFEGLPTVLIEGLMLRQVMVSTDCPTGPAEILNYGRAGLLVPIGDVEAMARAIVQALREPGTRQRLVQEAERYSALFDLPAFRARFLTLMERLCLAKNASKLDK